MRRGGLGLMLMALAAAASPATAAPTEPSLVFWKVDSPSPAQRAVLVQIANRSAGPMCIAGDFMSFGHVTLWRNGKPVAARRRGARARPAAGCALLPPGQSRTVFFRPWRDAVLPARGGFRICYRLAWRNDALRARAPDQTREICRDFR